MAREAKYLLFLGTPKKEQRPNHVCIRKEASWNPWLSPELIVSTHALWIPWRGF